MLELFPYNSCVPSITEHGWNHADPTWDNDAFGIDVRQAGFALTADAFEDGTEICTTYYVYLQKGLRAK